MTDHDDYTELSSPEEIDAYFNRPIPMDTSPENVARAVRFLEAWLPIGRQSMGSVAPGDVEVLMQFARENLPPSTT